ncbi:MAG: VWA domain-containing protein, partial [Pseudomonadota bacterium]
MIRKIYPAKIDTGSIQTEKSSSSDIEQFLKKASHIEKQTRGRLLFALDATMSRQPTWDRASNIQASMFTSAGQKTGLAVQL